jgi:hypothetical protein
MYKITSIKKLFHNTIYDKIELIVNKKTSIIFDFIQNSDTVDNIIDEMIKEMAYNFDNIENIKKDLMTLIKSNRISLILYD